MAFMMMMRKASSQPHDVVFRSGLSFFSDMDLVMATVMSFFAEFTASRFVILGKGMGSESSQIENGCEKKSSKKREKYKKSC